MLNINQAGTRLISSWQDFMLLWRLTNVYSVVIHALGVCVLGWCVTMDRKPITRED